MATPNLAAVATMVPTILYSGQLSTTGSTALYTVPAATSAIVKQAAVCNTSTSAANITVAIVPTGGTDDGTHTIVKTLSVAALDTVTLSAFLAGACLGAGDAIYATAGTGAVLNLAITGMVNT